MQTWWHQHLLRLSDFPIFLDKGLIYRTHQDGSLPSFQPCPHKHLLSLHACPPTPKCSFPSSGFFTDCSLCLDYLPWLLPPVFFSSQLKGPFSWKFALNLRDWPVASSLSHSPLGLPSSWFWPCWVGLVSLLVFLTTVGRALKDHASIWNPWYLVYIALHTVGTQQKFTEYWVLLMIVNRVTSSFVLR